MEDKNAVVRKEIESVKICMQPPHNWLRHYGSRGINIESRTLIGQSYGITRMAFRCLGEFPPRTILSGGRLPVAESRVVVASMWRGSKGGGRSFSMPERIAGVEDINMHALS